MRIFFADHALLNFRGHYYNYTKSVYEEFKSQGHEIHILGNKKTIPEITSDIPVAKVFTMGHDHQLKELGINLENESLWMKKWMKKTAYPFLTQIPRSIVHNMIAYETYFQKDLEDIFNHFELRETDLVIMNSVRHEELFAFASWLKNSKNKTSLPHFLFILHFSIYPCAEVGNTYRDVYAGIFSLFEEIGISDRLHFFTDSDSLAQEYKTITQLDVNVLPIPHNHHSVIQNSHVQIKQNNQIVLSYLGVALSIKGFHFIPFLCSQMKNEITNKEILLQLQIQSFGEKSIDIAADRLSFYNADIYHGTLNSSLYYQLLNNTDIMLLPYSLDFYHSQTSGVFSEAISHGKIPIVPKGTWMAKEAEKYHVGKSFFPGDMRNFCDAVLAVKSNIHEELAKARDASLLWNQFHSPASFIQVIINHLKGLFIRA